MEEVKKTHAGRLFQYGMNLEDDLIRSDSKTNDDRPVNGITHACFRI